MGDVGDTFRALRDEGQRKRERNRDYAQAALEQRGINFEIKNFGAHIIVDGPHGKIDYWPGTGRWICRISKRRMFGIRSLLQYVDGGKNG